MPATNTGLALVGTVLLWLLLIYEWILIVRIVLSWIVVINRNWTPKGILLLISEFVYTLTDPPIKLLQRFIKPIRIGGVGLDLTVLIILVIIAILMRLVSFLFS